MSTVQGLVENLQAQRSDKFKTVIRVAKNIFVCVCVWGGGGGGGGDDVSTAFFSWVNDIGWSSHLLSGHGVLIHVPYMCENF